MSRINYRIFLASVFFFVFFFSFFQTSQAGFFDWFRKNNSQSTQSAAAVASSAKQYILSISKSGSGVVTSDDGKINCGKQCKASFSANSKIVLKAKAGDNYKFERWNGCDKVLDGKCQTTLNKSKMIVVKFASKSLSSSQKSSSLSIGKASSSKSSRASSESSSLSYSSRVSSSKAFSSSSSLANKSSSSVSSVSYSKSFSSSSFFSGEVKKFYVLTYQNIRASAFYDDIKSISKKFYKEHSDDYDFLVVASGFLVSNDDGQTRVDQQFITIKNDTKGIGKNLYDNSADYGSGGKLKGVIFINDLDNALGSNKFFGINVFVHEIGHNWLMFLGNEQLKINRDGSHWSNFVDASVRINGKIYPNSGNSGIWQENSDGTFSGLNFPTDMFADESYRFRYHALDLYLMGFIPPSETNSVTLIIPKENTQNTSASKENTSGNQNISGTKRLITVQDLISLDGQRTPAYPNTQKEFNVALVLVTKNEAKEHQLSTMDWIVKNLPEAWSVATNYKSKLIVK